MSKVVHLAIVAMNTYAYAACCKWTCLRKNVQMSLLFSSVTCKSCQRMKVFKEKKHAPLR